MCRVSQNYIYKYIYGVYTFFLAGKSPNIRSYTVHIYGSGQPCTIHSVSGPQVWVVGSVTAPDVTQLVMVNLFCGSSTRHSEPLYAFL